MNTSSDDTVLQSYNSSFLLENNEDVVQFVNDCLVRLSNDPTLTITIKPEKSGGYFVGIVTTESLVDTQIQNCYFELPGISKRLPQAGSFQNGGDDAHG